MPLSGSRESERVFSMLCAARSQKSRVLQNKYAPRMCAREIIVKSSKQLPHFCTTEAKKCRGVNENKVTKTSLALSRASKFSIQRISAPALNCCGGALKL
jgi:competence CoiA-like predicted nuclease